MYLITNRALNTRDKKKGLDVFAKTPNPEGPNELRLMQVTIKNNAWVSKEIKDKLTPAAVKALKKKHGLDIDISKQWHGSLQVACELFAQAREQKKSILFFIHGYNNDVEDVMKASYEIERLYEVIVVPFTWPANGGGKISGTASYLSDKADARASSGALNRAVGKIQQLHLMLTAARKTQLFERAQKKHPDNGQDAQSHFVKLVEKDCPVTLNLLCHSMGNYVFKNTLKTGDNATSKLVFDNICLVAADANNKNHAQWVGKLDVRKRINIVINENDSALKVSRIKPGDEQLARLGHYTRKLNSPNAHYIDVTDAEHVGSEHTYFKGDAIANDSLKFIFKEMFNGRPVEQHLQFQSDNKSYKLAKSGI
jgi:esterase/lipase superfamily enzyme